MEREPGWRALTLDLQCEVLIRLWSSQPVGLMERPEHITWKGNSMVDPELLRTSKPHGLCSLHYPTYEDWENFPPASLVPCDRDYAPKDLVFCPNSELPPDDEKSVKQIRKMRRKRWQRTMECFEFVSHFNLPARSLTTFYLEPVFLNPLGINFDVQPFQQWHHECFYPAGRREKYQALLQQRIDESKDEDEVSAPQS